jgi:hypothetical protein
MTADLVGGPMTQDLNGITLAYKYAKSGSFRISYAPNMVRFGMPADLNDANTPTLSTAARMRKIGDDLYMVHWFSPGPSRAVHCVQIVDFKQMQVFLGALMPPGTVEDFDFAHIAVMTKATM